MGGARLKSAAHGAVRSRAFAELVTLLERFDRSRERLLATLTYHRVADPGDTPELDPALVSARPHEFQAQLEYLVASRPVVGLDEVLAAFRGDRELPPGAVSLTFDDAYRDFADHAWPIIRRLGVPVTLFVATAYPGDAERAFWWDRVHQAISATAADSVATPVGRLPLGTAREREAAVALLRRELSALPHADAMGAVDRLVSELGGRTPTNAVLDWAALRQLAADGVTLAPHTRTHPLLHRVSEQVAREELAGSAADLVREIGAAPPVLAYPGGGHSDEVVRIAAETGYELAFTTRRGLNDVGRSDRLRLRRINVGRRSSPALIRAQLLGWAALRGPRGGPASAPVWAGRG